MIVAALILSGTFVLCMHFLKDIAKGDEKSSPPVENKTTYNIYNTNSHNSYENSYNTTNTTNTTNEDNRTNTTNRTNTSTNVNTNRTNTNTNITNEDNVSEKMIRDEIAKLQKDILEKEKALAKLYKEISKLND